MCCAEVLHLQNTLIVVWTTVSIYFINKLKSQNTRKPINFMSTLRVVRDGLKPEGEKL
jgi:hypothetical protein